MIHFSGKTNKLSSDQTEMIKTKRDDFRKTHEHDAKLLNKIEDAEEAINILLKYHTEEPQSVEIKSNEK